MISQKQIEKIITIATQAPSGNNSQPWRFEVEGNTVNIFNIPDKDKILFNYKNRGSLIAHGALLENLVIASAEFGLSAEVKIFPEEKSENLVSRIALTESEGIEKDALYEFIAIRTTNRRNYESQPLGRASEEAIKNFEKTLPKEFGLFLSQKIEDIDFAAKKFSIGDRLIFENKSVHEALFSTVSWTEEAEQKKREGLYVGTKELSDAEVFVFKNLLSNWTFLKVFGWLGIASKAQKKREVLYKNSSAIGVILSKDLSRESFVKGGRVLQRLWLLSAKEGLAFQPLTVGMLYLGQKVLDQRVEELTLLQEKRVKESYEGILEKLIPKDKYPIFSFRLGYAKAPTASSLKKEPVIIFR